MLRYMDRNPFFNIYGINDSKTQPLLELDEVLSLNCILNILQCENVDITLMLLINLEDTFNLKNSHYIHMFVNISFSLIGK